MSTRQLDMQTRSSGPVSRKLKVGSLKYHQGAKGKDKRNCCSGLKHSATRSLRDEECVLLAKNRAQKVVKLKT